MTVSRRLLIVALLCLLPSVAAGLFTQFDLQSRRASELGELAMRQAELSEADLLSLIEAARQLGAIATHFATVENLRGECANRLATLHTRMPRYAFIAAFRSDGMLACGSPAGLIGNNPPWLAELAADPRSRVGQMVRPSAEAPPFLPVGVPIVDANGTRQGTMVVALDVLWLNSRQARLRERYSQQSASTSLIIADRAGSVISQHMSGGATAPNSMPDVKISALEWDLANQPAAGLARLLGPDPTERLAAYIPFKAQPDPFYVRVSLSLHAATAESDAVALRGAILVGAASLIALVLALAAGEAFIRRPTERLLASAQRWRDGDLATRAPTREETSEFGRLAVAFNEMAASLEQRDAERERAAQLLEARVAERTAALSESNARLHVEIAEREKTEAALLQAQKLQAVGRLAGGIAHDFNNLLATIMGNLELLERRIEPTQQRLHALIERATSAVQRGAQLTSRLLAFSRRSRTTTRAIDVNRLVGDLVTLASSTLGRRVEIQTRLDPGLWAGMADPGQLEAALLNLALNARDAMPEGGKLSIATRNETLTATEGEAAAGDYVCIEMTDTGTGMTQDVLVRAFEPFFTTKGPAGSGLGLSQVYGIAQQAGGTVRLRSQPGEGTTVSVLLPRATLEQDEKGVGEPRRKLRLPLTVLLVDDDPPVRQATAEMLQDIGCRVVEAGGGEEALAILRAPEGRKIGLMMLDYAMPGLTGLQVAQAARNMGHKMPALLITGFAEVGEPGETADPDLAAGVLHKPFSVRELEDAMTRLPWPAMDESPPAAG